MGFQQGLSGLNAAARNLDVIGNNVANSNTIGFKGSQALFADVFANAIGGSGGSGAGIGVAVSGIQAEFSQGNITTTNSPLDMAINGNGFFRLDTNGTITFSRNGQFHLDKDGYIVNPTGARVSGYGVNAQGQVVPSNPGPLQLSNADFPPAATSLSEMVLNLDSREATITAPFNINDSTTYNKASSMTVYDSLGNPHSVGTYFVKTAPGTWSVYGAADGAPFAAAMGTLTFKSDGTLDTTASAMPFNVSVALTNAATSPFDFTLDFTGTTQFGANFGVNTLKQDGYTAGRLSGFGVGADGMLTGRYTNGQSRTLGQLVLASFPNATGLQPLGNNNWGDTAASGQPTIGAPGSGNIGVLQSGAVEESNVDLTKELVNMITAQRVYQANAQTIKTQDQILSTLVNLR
ncbi:MAG: flagellar hook protein FlgE [Betaproteobacteria bacterium]|nr:flagellar hook protein FlgE [Betaproteobacteria bacterium]